MRVLAALAALYGYIALALGPQWQQLLASRIYLFDPLRALAAGDMTARVLIAATVLVLVVDWVLVAAAYRRAHTLNRNTGLAALVLVPFVQLPVLVGLALATPAQMTEEDGEASVDHAAPGSARTYIVGLLSGVAICVAGVVIGSLVLGSYGSGLFLATPFVVGITTAYLANRDRDIGARPTATLVSASIGLGGLALLGLAIEGAICLIMALPLIAVMAWLGAFIGRALASGRRDGRATLTSVAVLPMMLLTDHIAPPHVGFVSVESIEVRASPAAVWGSVVHMGPIPDAPRAPFRWGLAYPMRGQIIGSGVGAIRRGVFSTGIAYERVTEWQPGQKLSFVVLSDPPMMAELTPYAHVNPPHLSGYFRTRDALFTITPLPNGRTRLTLTTHHELDLAPAVYWTPIAQWAVHENKRRVLAHFRDQAEARSSQS